MAIAAAIILPIGLLFLLSGLIINFIQALLFILVRPFSKNIFRRINKEVAELLWLEIVWLFDWWANVKMSLCCSYTPRPEDIVTTTTLKASHISLLPYGPPNHCWDNPPSALVCTATAFIVPAFYGLTCPLWHGPVCFPEADKLPRQKSELSPHLIQVLVGRANCEDTFAVMNPPKSVFSLFQSSKMVQGAIKFS
ncbi:hypothetical protein MTR67_049133 [Solanum verrucosum]|uniref:Uncharacterized protein n=1 Tax=Solanum verrucosum TaxID=315347 RepID=A0AAF0UZ58_SOLVR|nr:hypothetical protein MTR67_049133 [Solanum verrucosum]